MFTQLTVSYRQSYSPSTINGTSIMPTFYYIGHDNAFVPTSLKFKFFAESYPFYYYRNVIPFASRGTYLNYNALVYPSSYEQDYLALYTEPAAKLIFGYELPDAVNFAYYDSNEQKLYTVAKTTNLIPGNDGVLCTYDSGTTFVPSIPPTIFLFNGIIIQRLIPYYEKLLNPFQNYHAYVYDYLQKNGTYNLRPPTYLPDGVPDHYTLYFPKYMLVVNGVYYVIQSGDFVQFTPNTAYVSLDELNTNGFTIDDINVLDKSVWETHFNLYKDEFSILSNGYVTPSIILGEYWLDKYDVNRFIWTIPGKQKTLILTGDI